MKLENMIACYLPNTVLMRTPAYLVAMRQSAYRKVVIFRGVLQRIDIRGKTIQ